MAKPVIKKSGDGEDWLATYADAITLLMAFFVMILHFKDYDAIEKQQAAEALRKIPNFVVSSKIDITIKPSPAKTPEIVESAI